MVIQEAEQKQESNQPINTLRLQKIEEEAEEKKKKIKEWKEKKEKERLMLLEREKVKGIDKPISRINDRQQAKLEKYKINKEMIKMKQKEQEESKIKSNNFSREEYQKIKQKNLENIEKLKNKNKQKMLQKEEDELKNEINVLKIRDKWSNVESKLNEKTTSVKTRELVNEKERESKLNAEKGKFGNHYSGVECGNLLAKSNIGLIMK